MASDESQPERCCALCGRALEGPVFRTTSFLDESDPLFRYANQAMHWGCYARWAFQRRFAERHFSFWAEREDPDWPVVYRGADVLVRSRVDGDEVAILLRETGSVFHLPRSRWQAFLAYDWRNQAQHLLETRCLVSVLDRLAWVRFPEHHGKEQRRSSRKRRVPA